MSRQPSKKDLLLQMLDEGLVMLHLDARQPGVIVPSFLKEDPHLRLNLSYRFGLPDLQIDDEAISTTLSFRQTPFHCVIPFHALWALSQPPASEMTLFPDAMPLSLFSNLVRELHLGEEEEAEEGGEEREGRSRQSALEGGTPELGSKAQQSSKALDKREDERIETQKRQPLSLRSVPPPNKAPAAVQPLPSKSERGSSSRSELPAAESHTRSRPALQLIVTRDEEASDVPAPAPASRGKSAEKPSFLRVIKNDDP
jgi:stringent starvation protein B